MVGDAGQRKQVIAFIRSLPSEHLAACIAARRFRFRQHASEAQDSHPAAVDDEYVVRVNIAVHDAPAMSIGDA